MIALLVMFDITLALLAGFHYTSQSVLEVTSGGFGVITAVLAYYLGLASFLTEETSYFSLPLWSLAVSE